LDRVGAELSVERVQVNGSPGLFLRLNGELDMVVTLGVEGGLVTGLYTIRNPEKLSYVHREIPVSR
jgi:RNA polymerase sigma-70 factor (ECF subfamily)